MTMSAKILGAKTTRRSVLSGLSVMPAALLLGTNDALASREWVTLHAGGTGTNRFKNDTDGAGIWAKCYSVTHNKKLITGNRPCKITFARGKSVEGTVRLDKEGTGETGEYDLASKGRIIGVKVCV